MCVRACVLPFCVFAMLAPFADVASVKVTNMPHPNQGSTLLDSRMSQMYLYLNHSTSAVLYVEPGD